MLISYHSYDSFADLTSKEPETFLNFIHSPIPCGRVQMCRILRQEEPKGSFELFLDGVAATADISILTARKIPTSGLFSEYRIFRKDKNAPGPLSSDSIVAVVRSNFWGTAFEITSPSLFHLDASLHQDINIGCILYKPNFLGIHGPRRMRILFPYLNSTFTAKSLSCTGSIVHSKVDPTFFSLYKKNLAKNNVLLLKNKQPAWSEEHQSHVLNFHGRVSHPSVKNFQLIHPYEGRTLDYDDFRFIHNHAVRKGWQGYVYYGHKVSNVPGPSVFHRPD